MTREEFYNDIENDVKNEIDNATIELTNITKTNGTEYKGLCVRKNNDTIAPNFNLDAYYNDIENGRASYEDILENILDNVKHSVPAETQTFLNMMETFDKAKGMLTMKLMSAALNKDYTKNTVFQSTGGDMIAVPIVEMKNMSTVVINSMIDK